MLEFFGELRYLDIAVAEEPAVDIGKALQVLVQIGVSLRHRSVEHAEEVDECAPPMVGREGGHVVVEGVVVAEEFGILGKEEEDQADA